MKLFGQGFASVTLTQDTIEISRPADKIREGTAIDVECGHALFDRSIKISASGMDDAEVDVGVGDTHGGIGCAVRARVHLNCLKCVFLGALVVAEPGVGGGGVEDPLGVVEHEVVVGVAGEWELGEGVGSSGEGLVCFAAVADSGQSAGLLQGELNLGAGVTGDGLARAVAVTTSS